MFDEKPQHMLFRKSAVDALSQTEELDQLIHIVRPAAWLRLAAVVMLVGVVLGWSIWGRIPVRIPGKGILIKGGGLYQVMAVQNGRIEQIFAKPGNIVESGQVLVKLERPELRDEIEVVRSEAADLESLDEKTQETELRIKALTRRLAMLVARYQATTNISSPYEGRVLEILADPGEITSRGSPLVTLERADRHSDSLEAVCFVSAAEGKKIQVGMKAEISPASVKKEEYGVMLGRVTRVAAFPTSRLGMVRILKNEELVEALTSGGAAVAVHVRPLRNEVTPSGYTWSTPEGPPVEVHSGELCTLAVTIREQRPINIVFSKIH